MCVLKCAVQNRVEITAFVSKTAEIVFRLIEQSFFSQAQKFFLPTCKMVISVFVHSYCELFLQV